MTLLDTGQVVGGWVGGRPSVVAGGTLRARGYSGSRDLGRWWPWARSQRGALLVGTHCHTAHRLTGMGCAQTLVLYSHMRGDKAQTLLTALLTHAHACTHMLRPHAQLCTHAPTPSPLRHRHTHTTHMYVYYPTPCSLQAPPYLTHIPTSPQAPSQPTAPENQSR